MKEVYLIEKQELIAILRQYESKSLSLIKDTKIRDELANELHGYFGLKSLTLESYLNQPIDSFLNELPNRARSALRKLSIHTVKDLTNVYETELMGVRNCGEATVSSIKKVILEPVGLDFKTDQPILDFK